MVMKTHFLISSFIGLVLGFVVLGCSEKVESEEKNGVVDEEVTESKEVDPVDDILANGLRMMIIPRIDFEDVTLDQARDFIQLRVAEVHDDEFKARIGDSVFAIHSSVDNPMPVIRELRLRNVPLSAVLRYISLLTEMECVVDERMTFVPKNPSTAWNSFSPVLEEKGDVTKISEKLSKIRLPSVNFENTSIEEAIDYLRYRSVELNVTEPDRIKKGINFVGYLPKGMAPPYIDKLQMTDVSFEEVLKEICGKTGMRYELDPYSVILVPRDLK